MAHIRPLLNFQTNHLGYSFREVGLLSRALDLDPEHPINLSPNQTFELLHAVGCSALKLVTAQHVLQTSGIDAGEGELSQKRDRLLNVARVQTEVGKRLFLDDHGEVVSCIRMKSGSTTLLQFDLFLKSVLGAVLIDAGGFAGGGVAAVQAVFLRLWKPFLEAAGSPIIKPLRACFTVPAQIAGFWVQKSVHVFASVLCGQYLGCSFNNSDLLCEAIIHKSFYDPIRVLAGSLHQPDYQRLEFLGDSVLELVIAHYLMVADGYSYPTPQAIKQAIQKLTSRASQRAVAAKIRVQDFVQVNNAQQAQVWMKYDDIVESVIGAMYVDGENYGKLVAFIMDKWELCAPSPNDPTYGDLESKLGYKFQNETLLVTALTHPGASKQLQCMSYSHLSLFGREVLKMLAAEYVVCTCKPNAKYGVMESLVTRLISPNTLKEIAKFLQLEKLARLPKNLVGNHNGAFRRYENFVYALMAAIYVDVGSVSSPRITEVFYCVWNVYLMQCPAVQSLGDCFPSSSESQRTLRESLGRVLSDSLIYEIEENIGHTFNNKNLLEQALTDRACRSYTSDIDIGDSTRFMFIADYVVLPFVACFVGLLSTEHHVPDIDVLRVMNRNLWKEIRYFDSDLMTASYTLPFGETKGFDYPSVVAGIVGAVFVDDKRALQSDNLLKCTGYVSKLPVASSIHQVEAQTTTHHDCLNSTSACTHDGSAVAKGMNLIRRKQRKRRTGSSKHLTVINGVGSHERAYKLQNYNSPVLELDQQICNRTNHRHTPTRDFRHESEDDSWMDRDYFDEIYYKYYAESDMWSYEPRFRSGNHPHRIMQSRTTCSSCYVIWMGIITKLVLVVAFVLLLFGAFMFGGVHIYQY